VPFSLRFTTLNKLKGTGGKDVILDKALLLVADKASRTGTPEKRTKTAVASTRKNPYHSQHQTINVRDLKGERTTKVHKYLITEFNGQRVYW